MTNLAPGAPCVIRSAVKNLPFLAQRTRDSSLRTECGLLHFFLVDVMGEASFQNATPAVQSWLLRHTRGGRHGRRLGSRVAGVVSTAVARLHPPDVGDVPARGDGVGAVP